MSRADELHAAMLRRAQEDPNILGLFVGGSRGKGAVTPHSDYDCDIVVTDAVAAEYRARFGGDDSGFNLAVVGLSDFAAYAAIGSEFLRLVEEIGRGDCAAQRTVFAGVRALVSRHGLGGVVDSWDREALAFIERGAAGR